MSSLLKRWKAPLLILAGQLLMGHAMYNILNVNFASALSPDAKMAPATPSALKRNGLTEITLKNMYEKDTDSTSLFKLRAGNKAANNVLYINFSHADKQPFLKPDEVQKASLAEYKNGKIFVTGYEAAHTVDNKKIPERYFTRVFPERFNRTLYDSTEVTNPLEKKKIYAKTVGQAFDF